MKELIKGELKTMSSIEIAALTGKLHTNVIADIRTQIISGLYGIEKMNDISVINEIQGVTVFLDNRKYWSEVLLDREHTLTLMTGYDVKARHAINKRWLELEAEKAESRQLPTNFIEALELLVVSEKERVAALEQVQKKQELIERKDELLIASNEASIKSGEILIREFVKSNDAIQIGEKQFFQWMRDRKLISEKNEPFQKYVDDGYFTYKPSEEKHGGKYRYTLRITPRGRIWLAARYIKDLKLDESLDKNLLKNDVTSIDWIN